MTANSVRTHVRQILGDAVQPYRWTDDVLRGYIQTAVRRLNSRVPATRYAGFALQDYIPLPDEDDGTIAVDDRYAEALALYTAYLAYFNDATDTVNAERAAACLSRAEALMI